MKRLEQIIGIIKQKFPSEKNLDVDTILFSLDINSIEFILLLSCIEEELNIEIDIEDVDDFKIMTIGDIIKIAKEHSCNSEITPIE